MVACATSFEEVYQKRRERAKLFPFEIRANEAYSMIKKQAIKKLDRMGIPLQLSKLQKAALICTAKIMEKHIICDS